MSAPACWCKASGLVGQGGTSVSSVCHHISRQGWWAYIRSAFQEDAVALSAIWDQCVPPVTLLRVTGSCCMSNTSPSRPDSRNFPSKPHTSHLHPPCHASDRVLPGHHTRSTFQQQKPVWGWSLPCHLHKQHRWKSCCCRNQPPLTYAV